MEAAKPENEAERLAILRKLGVLDTALEERFERITRMVCRTLNVPIAAISLVDQNRQWFKSIQGLSVSETPRSSAFCAHTILDAGTLVVPDALHDNRFIDNPLVNDDPNIRFYAGSPLIIQDGIHLGSLCAIDRKPRTIEPDEVEFLEDLARMVCVEFQTLVLSKSNQELLAELKQAELAALVDPLSRLWNRAGGQELLQREWKAAQRKSAPISIAMLDIDHFKKVNDSLGHDVGDQVIRQVSRNTLASIRPRDVVARWGGEEFLIIFSECGSNDLPQALERVRTGISSQSITCNGKKLNVTASLGAASVVPTAETGPSDLIKLADLALYEAKKQGRDRFVINRSSNSRPQEFARS